MKRVVIIRGKSTEHGTPGRLVADLEGFVCASLELPWNDNRTGLSCIPVGEYQCIPYPSAKFGNVYMVQNVPGRYGILFHYGNWAGDVQQGYRSHSRGCILLGQKHGIVDNQPGLLNSRATFALFKQHLSNEPFKLTIR